MPNTPWDPQVRLPGVQGVHPTPGHAALPLHHPLLSASLCPASASARGNREHAGVGASALVPNDASVLLETLPSSAFLSLSLLTTFRVNDGTQLSRTRGKFRVSLV